jgi:hypothetical protein
VLRLPAGAASHTRFQKRACGSTTAGASEKEGGVNPFLYVDRSR